MLSGEVGDSPETKREIWSKVRETLENVRRNEEWRYDKRMGVGGRVGRGGGGEKEEGAMDRRVGRVDGQRVGWGRKGNGGGGEGGRYDKGIVFIGRGNIEGKKKWKGRREKSL